MCIEHGGADGKEHHPASHPAVTFFRFAALLILSAAAARAQIVSSSLSHSSFLLSPDSNASAHWESTGHIG